MIPNFEYEQKLWQQGKNFIAGIDEVGRGAFAGPLVVAAVIFPPNFNAEFITAINDSKQVKPRLRIQLAALIKKYTDWSIASSPVSYINRFGVGKATFKAMRQAINNLPTCEHLLVDAFYIPHFRHFANKQTPIIKGDEISLSIAAASIIAKVHRDQLMKQLHFSYPEYGFGRHKGYGTKKHQTAILNLGTLRHHRTSFVKKFIS